MASPEGYPATIHLITDAVSNEGENIGVTQERVAVGGGAPFGAYGGDDGGDRAPKGICDRAGGEEGSRPMNRSDPSRACDSAQVMVARRPRHCLAVDLRSYGGADGGIKSRRRDITSDSRSEGYDSTNHRWS